jgi:hypothetical protein
MCALPCDDPEFVSIRNAVLGFANKFHRTGMDVEKLKPIDIPMDDVEVGGE